MRWGTWAVWTGGWLGCLLCTGLAEAQQRGSVSLPSTSLQSLPTFQNVDTSRIVFQHVDVSNAVGTRHGMGATSNSTFSFLTNIFRRPSAGFERRLPTNNLPSPDSFPSTKYPNAFQPLRPVLPGAR